MTWHSQAVLTGYWSEYRLGPKGVGSLLEHFSERSVVSTPYTWFFQGWKWIPLLELSKHSSNTFCLIAPSLSNTLPPPHGTTDWSSSSHRFCVTFSRKRGHRWLYCLLLSEQLKSWSHYFSLFHFWSRGKPMNAKVIYLCQIYRNLLLPSLPPPCLTSLFTCLLPCLFLWMPSIAPAPVRKPRAVPPSLGSFSGW